MSPDSRISPDYTYPDPVLSLWQSAVAITPWQASVTEETVQTTNPLMVPVHEIAVAARTGMDETPSIALESIVSDVIDCAQVAKTFLWAEIKGDKELASLCAQELKKSVCEAAGWATCVTNYLKFKADGGSFPYIAGKNPVVGFDRRDLRIAVVGDWGTGEEPAANLLREVKAKAPDVLVHLGDIYFSCTRPEAERNFLKIVRGTFGSEFPVFSLCGNHDMYSGGDGYYWLLGQINQEASYFALENPDWQLLGMDTGHEDRNPMTVASSMTSLNPAELDWILDKINSAGSKRTILLSHHPLFSAFASVGRDRLKPYGYNPRLYQSFKTVLNRIDLWFWGHEHTLAVYDPFIGLDRGRCVGCSAVPVFKNQQAYVLDKSLSTLDPEVFPTWIPKAQVGTNGTAYDHAFALLSLKGPNATVEYYEVPIGGSSSLLWNESL